MLFSVTTPDPGQISLVDSDEEFLPQFVQAAHQHASPNDISVETVMFTFISSERKSYPLCRRLDRFSVLLAKRWFCTEPIDVRQGSCRRGQEVRVRWPGL